MTPPYSNGPYFGGGYNSSFAYPIPGTVGPGPIFDGQYATNVVSDPTLQYMLNDTNATQSAYFNSAMNGYGYGYGDSNLNWYNSNIAPVLADAQNVMANVTGGGGMPPAGYPPQGQPGQYPPGMMGGEHQQEEAGEGKNGGNGMIKDVGGFAAVGAGIGFFCGGGPATAAIGAGVGAVVGGIKNFLFG